MTRNLTHDEKCIIANALNAAATRVQEMAETRHYESESTREVWFQKAENKRALALKVMGWPEDTDAAEWGRRAGASGLSPAVCPYGKGDAKRAVWRLSYKRARGEEYDRTVAKWCGAA